MKEFFRCQECVDLLTDFLEGTLETDVKRRLEEHLAGCAPCINFVKTLEKSEQMTHRLKEQQVDVPVDVQHRLKSFLKQEVLEMSLLRKK